MTPDQYDRIQIEFLRIRQLPTTQQAEQLRRLDDSLRGDVESLLHSDQLCGQFLESKRESASSTDNLSNQTLGIAADDRVNSSADTVDLTHSGPDAPEPRHVGRYRLLQQIGEGGQGTVYLAEQQRPIQRKVAIKLIKPGMDSKQILARFDAEQQALAMMDHPSIARVLDAGATESGAPYFVMELVKGVPIHDFCDQERCELRERLRLFLQVCDAVHHAHRKGIIHRDIKPSNVLVTMGEREPIAKVIDFGIAKALETRLTDQTLFTEYGQMIGTLEYMSPEQAEMSAVEIDTRSDVYSLGVLLYQLLTGETPISKEQLLKNGVFEIPKQLRETEPKTPSLQITERQQQLTRVDRESKPGGLAALHQSELDWIALKALAKDRSRRYETVLDLSRDIQRFLDGEPVEAHPPTWTYKAQKFISRYRIAAIVSAIVLASISLGILGLVGGLRQARRAAHHADRERDRAIAARESADDSRTKLSNNVYAELVDSAWRAANRQDHGRARDLLDKCLPELRGWEWSFVDSQLRNHSESALRPIGESAIRKMVFVEPHNWVACALENGKIEIWDLKNHTRIRQIELAHRANAIHVSPDGERIFVGTQVGRVMVLDTNTWSVTNDLQLGLGGVYDIAVSANGQRIAACTGGGWIALFELEAETQERTESDHKQVELSKTRPKSTTDLRLKVAQKWKLASRLTSLSWTTDQKSIVGAGLDGKAYVINIAKDTVRDVAVSKTDLAAVLALPDSLVFLSDDSALSIDSRLSENTLVTIARTNARASAIAIDDQGRVIVGSGDGTVVRDSASSSPVETIANFGSAVNAFTWSPKRQQLLVALSDGQLRWIKLSIDDAPWNTPEHGPMSTASSCPNVINSFRSTPVGGCVVST